MVRLPPFLDDCTATFPRTTNGLWLCDATEAVALTIHRQPLSKRFFYALMRHGFLIFQALLAVSVLSGCEDLGTTQAMAYDIADAQHAAQAEALAQRRPKQ